MLWLCRQFSLFEGFLRGSIIFAELVKMPEGKERKSLTKLFNRMLFQLIGEIHFSIYSHMETKFSSRRSSLMKEKLLQSISCSIINANRFCDQSIKRDVRQTNFVICSGRQSKCTTKLCPVVHIWKDSPFILSEEHLSPLSNSAEKIFRLTIIAQLFLLENRFA